MSTKLSKFSSTTLQELKNRNVSDVVRVCEPTYNKSILEANSIKVSDWPFADGTIPPSTVIQNFLNLCDERFPGGINGAANYSKSDGGASSPAIVCNCFNVNNAYLLY